MYLLGIICLMKQRVGHEAQAFFKTNLASIQFADRTSSWSAMNKAANPNHVDAEAWALCDTMVQGTKQSVLDGNYDGYSEYFHIPFTMQTQLGDVVVESDEQHREVFARVMWQYRKQNVTDAQRNLLAAHIFRNEEIVCVHESMLYSNSRLVQSSIKVLSTLRKFCDHWLIVDSRYSVGDCINLNRALYGPRYSEVQSIMQDSCSLVQIR